MARNSRRLSAAMLAGVALAFSLACWSADDFMLEGNYVSASDQSAIVTKAIDTAVADMNFIKRPIARSRLSKTNPVYRRIRLARTPTAVEVQFDERKPIQMPENGTAIRWVREDGEQLDVSAVMHDGQLIQTFKAEDGTRVNTFRWDATAQRLYLDATITSPRLPQPLKYTLAYRRE